MRDLEKIFHNQTRVITNTLIERKIILSQLMIQGLSFSYPASPQKKVLDRIELEVERGQYIAVCGKSGSGKTTLLRHCKTVLSPVGRKEGNIFLDGIPLEQISLREQSTRIGYVLQNPESQIVTDKVWHELAFGLESLGCDNTVIRRRVGEMAHYFGIQNWFHKDVKDLSGGEKQILNLASVMVMQPEILILDEPVSQLDPIAASDFLTAIHKINTEFGTTILISEHQLEEVIPYSDNVLILDSGQMTGYGTPEEAVRLLKESKNEMFYAMPTCMQIFSQSEGEGNCPLTVREGRKWITEYLTGYTKNKTNVELSENSSGKAAIELKDIWFRFHNNAPYLLKDLSLTIEEGSFFAIVGGNGTGKTTLLKLIAGLLKTEHGKILLHGKHIGGKKVKKHNSQEIVMIPQDPGNMFTRTTVLAELEEMTDNKTEIQDVCQRTEINELLQSHPYDLSAGEQQRVAIAKVLLLHPSILLLDEPTKGVDVVFKRKFAKMITDWNERGITVIMVNHDIEFCARYADKAAMLFDGSILSTDTADKFFAENYFYTTAASKMVRHIDERLILTEEVIALCHERAAKNSLQKGSRT